MRCRRTWIQSDAVDAMDEADKSIVLAFLLRSSLMDLEKVVSELRGQLDDLKAAIAALERLASGTRTVAVRERPKKRAIRSDAHRKNQSERMKAYWKKRRASQAS